MWRKNNTEIQKNQNQLNNNRNSNNFSWDAEVIQGNAATGEQVWINRQVQSDTPITYEQMKKNWEEMEKEAGKLKNDYPGQVISAISYQDGVGNQVIRLTPVKELIFPVGVPIYDEKGNKIVGLDNIKAEIGKRREEWARWEREGKLSEHVEEHYADDGRIVRIKFRAAPKRLHSNEINGETEWFINNANEQWKNRQDRSGIGNSQEFSEETSEVKFKKPRTGTEKAEMEIDNKPENSPTEPIIKLLTDDEIKTAKKDEIISLIERLSKELEIREKIEKNSNNSSQTSNYQVSTQELENQLSKAENYLESLQVSNTTVNNDDKNSNVGWVMAVVGVVSALAIGGVALMKSKFSKNKKK